MAPDDGGEDHVAAIHTGDLGNVNANAMGLGLVDRRLTTLELAAVVGRTFAIHVNADDCASQPDGEARRLLDMHHHHHRVMCVPLSRALTTCFVSSLGLLHAHFVLQAIVEVS